MPNSGPGYATHPEHTVLVRAFQGRVIVEANGAVLADTTHALALSEASYPVVYYIPRGDTQMGRLVATSQHTSCPFKGEASYFSIASGAENAVWSYERPYDEVSSIREYLAFYPSRVDAIRVEPAA